MCNVKIIKKQVWSSIFYLKPAFYNNVSTLNYTAKLSPQPQLREAFGLLK